MIRKKFSFLVALIHLSFDLYFQKIEYFMYKIFVNGLAKEEGKLLFYHLLLTYN